MPQRVEPMINLGLVYETANRLPDAKAVYETALATFPDNPVALGNLARVCIRMDDDPTRIHFLLSELVMHDDRPDWTGWAKNQLAVKYLQFDGAASVAINGTSGDWNAENQVPVKEFVPPPAPANAPEPTRDTLPPPNLDNNGSVRRATPIEMIQPMGTVGVSYLQQTNGPYPVPARTVELSTTLMPAPTLPASGEAWQGNHIAPGETLQSPSLQSP